MYNIPVEGGLAEASSLALRRFAKIIAMNTFATTTNATAEITPIIIGSELLLFLVDPPDPTSNINF